MRERLEEIKVLQSNERRCMPNLRGANMVGRDVGGRSYVAQVISRSEQGRRRRGCKSVLDTDVMSTIAGETR